MCWWFVTDGVMLSSNTLSSVAAAAMDSTAVNGSAAGSVNGAVAEVNRTNEKTDGPGPEPCYTPVTDPDSIALLAAMHEANRYATCLSHILMLSCCQ